jgi:hypothetical protein
LLNLANKVPFKNQQFMNQKKLNIFFHNVILPVMLRVIKKAKKANALFYLENMYAHVLHRWKFYFFLKDGEEMIMTSPRFFSFFLALQLLFLRVKQKKNF